jgi:predicted PurR-regulated permease PerM
MQPAIEPDLPTGADAVLVAEPDRPVAVAPGAFKFTVHPTVNAKGLALGILAVVAVVFALEWAQTFFVSLLVGVLLAYTLNPLVAALERLSIPRVIAVVLVMAAVIGALGAGAWSLRGQTQTIIDQLPEAVSKFSAGVARLRHSQFGAMAKVQSAATEMERAAAQATGPVVPKPATTHVVIDQPAFKLSDFLLAGSKSALGFLGQTVMVLFLTFFLLVGGDTFKRKLVRLTGPKLSQKKITVQILDDINDSIQKYLFMLLTTNVLVGLLSWIVFYWIGLDNAGAWAVVAGLLHVIPYLGPGVTAAATGMAAFMQFESFGMALLVGGASLTIATIVGTLITTWMTGRIAGMNPAAVFISLLFWGWLWGIWGMLLSIPIIVIVRVVSQHVEQLHPVAELLGD